MWHIIKKINNILLTLRPNTRERHTFLMPNFLLTLRPNDIALKFNPFSLHLHLHCHAAKKLAAPPRLPSITAVPLVVKAICYRRCIVVFSCTVSALSFSVLHCCACTVEAIRRASGCRVAKDTAIGWSTEAMLFSRPSCR